MSQPRPLPAALVALLTWTGSAWADEEPTETAAAEDAEAASAEAAPNAAEEPEVDLPPVLTLGPIVSSANLDVQPPAALRLGSCIEALPAPRRGPAWQSDQALMVQLRLKRGRARLVTVSDVPKGLEPLRPCLERELAAVEWPVKRGTLEVPVVLEPARGE